MGDIRNACAGLANVVGQGGEKNERERERNGRRQREDERLRRTPGNSKFSLQRGIVISIQVFRMNYWPVRLSPWVDIFGTTSTPLSLSLSPSFQRQVYPTGGSIIFCIFYPAPLVLLLATRFSSRNATTEGRLLEVRKKGINCTII